MGDMLAVKRGWAGGARGKKERKSEVVRLGPKIEKRRKEV